MTGVDFSEDYNTNMKTSQQQHQQQHERHAFHITNTLYIGRTNTLN